MSEIEFAFVVCAAVLAVLGFGGVVTAIAAGRSRKD